MDFIISFVSSWIFCDSNMYLFTATPEHPFLMTSFELFSLIPPIPIIGVLLIFFNSEIGVKPIGLLFGWLKVL